MDVITLNQLEKETKKEPKHKLLKKLDENTTRHLKLVCDPMVTFGITVDEDEAVAMWRKTSSRFPSDDRELFSDLLFALSRGLRDRKWTGNDAESRVNNLLSGAPDEDHLKWAIRFLNKNLRAGFSSSTLNKIWPGMIEEFEVSLATPHDPDKHDIVGDWFFEPKLDGLRMVVFDGKAHTRNGRQILTVDHILEELADQLDPDEWVVDGEIMGVGDFDEGSGQIRRKSTGTNNELYYNVFDLVPRKEWEKKKGKMTFAERRAALCLAVKESENVKIVPSIFKRFESPASGEELANVRDSFMSLGYEGGMGKNADAPYEWKRGLAVMKFKKMETIDCRITGSFEGKGKHKGRLGGVTVDIEGVETRVGSGFTDKQRGELWKVRGSLVDRMAEIQYQNKTRDGSLRFPVFIKFRGDKE